MFPQAGGGGEFYESGEYDDGYIEEGGGGYAEEDYGEGGYEEEPQQRGGKLKGLGALFGKKKQPTAIEW